MKKVMVKFLAVLFLMASLMVACTPEEDVTPLNATTNGQDTCTTR
jgi:hypothetical protein